MNRILSDTSPAASADTTGWGRATANPLDLIAPVLTSAAGTIGALGHWRGRDAGISVVAAISQSARSICPDHYHRQLERAAEIALMQYLCIDPDEMSLRAIAAWEDRSGQTTVIAALTGAAAECSKLFAVTA